MSLLPSQIIPQAIPFGHTNADGSVTIEQNWWLLFYNLCQGVLSNGSGANSTELTTLALAPERGVDYDRQMADLRTLVASLSNPAGRIAALEREVQDLKTLLYGMKT